MSQRFSSPSDWTAPSTDPNDEQFGHLVAPTTLEATADYDAVLVGEPYDGGVIGRPGASEAPAAIREALAGVKTHHVAGGPVTSLCDLGDVVLDAEAGVATTQATVADVAGDLYARDTVPIFLGGDNSLTYGNVAPLVERDGAVGVVSFDAHLDCREVRDAPTSGTPYRQLLEAGLSALAVVGGRHFETSTEYHEYLATHDGTVVTAEAVGDGVATAVERALAAVASVDHVYVSLDLDVLDVVAAPGVSAPTPGGVSTRELFRMLRRVAADPRVVGIEVVECAPPLDVNGRSVDAAARAVAHTLSGLTYETEVGDD